MGQWLRFEGRERERLFEAAACMGELQGWWGWSGIILFLLPWATNSVWGTTAPGSSLPQVPHSWLSPPNSTPAKSWSFSCGVAKFNFAYMAKKPWLFIKIPAHPQGMRWKLGHVEAFYFLQRCVCKTLVESTAQGERHCERQGQLPSWGEMG